MRIWLKALRERKNLSQNQLAIKTNIDVSSISKYELGIRRPSPEKAKIIADVLGFDWTMFYADKNDTA